MDIERRLLFAERQRALVFAHPQGYVVTREAAMSAFAGAAAAWPLAARAQQADRMRRIAKVSPTPTKVSARP
jgi:hypothetical protein